MKKFHFTLEGVARVRELGVKERERTLAAAHDAQRQAEEARVGAAARLEHAVASSPAGTIVHVRHLLELDAERRRLRTELLREENRLQHEDRRVEAERGLLIEARRGAQAVEKLRERRYAEFLRAVVRAEQKVTDEAAARSHRQARVS